MRKHTEAMNEEKELKTARQWFELFPEPYRTQAIENAENYDDFILSETFDSPQAAVYDCFLWDITPQGQGIKYWKSFYDALLNNQINLQRPDKNSSLIAAAPEMYEALQLCVQNFERNRTGGCNGEGKKHEEGSPYVKAKALLDALNG